jgi:hypothetical protein
MPSLRSQALKEVFEKGVEAFSKKDLGALFKKGSQRTHLFRHDWSPKELAERGFEKAGRPDDIRGLYYGRSPDDLKYLVPAETSSQARNIRPNVEGIPRPGAKWKDISTKSFDEEVENLGIDFGTREDPSGLQEVIQLEPNNTLAKIRVKNKNVYRILGLTGALGGGMAALDQLDPNEAEASPIGKLVSKVVKGPVSSAARTLVGHEISGMKIKNVIKGREPWRYITFEGTDKVIPATKDVINDLARQFGEEMYTGLAEVRQPAEALKMAIKSAEMRLRLKGTGPYTKEELKALDAQHVNNLNQLEIQPKKKVWVRYRNERIQLPETYADILEKYNLIKRMK